MTDYRFTHDGRVFTPHGTYVSIDENDPRNKSIEEQQAIDAHNKSIETAELAQWMTQPDQFSAYVTDKPYVSTWLGTNLGLITSRSRYRHNFGGHMTSIRVKGSNGATYAGRFGSDWSQLVRLHKCK